MQAAPLTLAVADLPVSAPVLVASAEGYFAAEGLALNIIHCVNGKHCLQHLLDGEAQFVTVAETPIVLSSFDRSNFSIIATFARSTTSNKLAVRTDRGIRSPADLAGKRIGIVQGTSGHYFTDTFLAYNGIDQASVVMVPTAQNDLVPDLASGKLDAAGSFEPFGYQARRALGNKVQFLKNPMIFDETFHLVAAKSMIGAHDADMLKLLRAIARANRLIKDAPQRVRAILGKQLKSTPELIDAVWPDYRYELSLEQSLLTSLEGLARWAKREGLVENPQLPNYLDFVYAKPLQALDRYSVTLVQ
ncbi:ABC transporter substrate-binding protein [Herminiimonas sp. CN]|uniref:ABC transporter substrate-binding protein n=1 Tax=Herminiimonas sp. CN TaxID=1349818 RepID=UPI00138E2BB7|nr:ABC transporter substrate-binding protein [Herminiimonas sp. CN]